MLARLAQQRIDADPDLANRIKSVTSSIAVPESADFIRSLTIESPQGDDSVALVPFDLWPMQEETLKVIHTNDRVIILKARQLGITWLIIADDLHDCLFHPGITILYFSKDLIAANEIIRRVKGMYSRYAGDKPRLTGDNKSELAWSNGSRMLSLAATESAGRSFTASKVRLDEYAHMHYGQEVYTAVKPTIDSGGKMIILSTANGQDDPFHLRWQAAVKGESSFVPVFLPWYARPGRDAAWYALVEKDAFNSAEMRREYPATPEDAFSPLTADRFLPHMSLWDACYADLPPLHDREPIVWAADAGIKHDSFAFIGVTRCPGRHADVAPRVMMSWVPQPGQPLDFIQIELEIIAMMRRWHTVQFCYDSHQMHQMAQRIAVQGFWVEEFSQKDPRLVADKQLRDLIINRRLAHTGDADLRQAIDDADCEVSEDRKTLRIVKRSPHRLIDAVVALSMATAKCLELNI